VSDMYICGRLHEGAVCRLLNLALAWLVVLGEGDGWSCLMDTHMDTLSTVFFDFPFRFADTSLDIRRTVALAFLFLLLGFCFVLQVCLLYRRGIDLGGLVWCGQTDRGVYLDNT
jgi:hypothetical protein